MVQIAAMGTIKEPNKNRFRVFLPLMNNPIGNPRSITARNRNLKKEAAS